MARKLDWAIFEVNFVLRHQRHNCCILRNHRGIICLLGSLTQLLSRLVCFALDFEIFRHTKQNIVVLFISSPNNTPCYAVTVKYPQLIHEIMAVSNTTFPEKFIDELRQTFAKNLARDTKFTTETNVEITTDLPEDDLMVTTTADIVLYSGSKPEQVINFIVGAENIPPEPVPMMIGESYQQLYGLDDPPRGAVIVSVSESGGVLNRHPVTFKKGMWDSFYGLLMTDWNVDL